MFGAILLAAAAQPVEPLQMDDMVAAAERLRPFVARVDVRLDVPEDQPLIPTEHWAFAVPWGSHQLVALAPLVPEDAELEVVGPEGRAKARRVGAVSEDRVVLLETAEPLARLGLRAPERHDRPRRLAPLFTIVGEGEGATVATGYTLRSAPEFEGLIVTDLELKLGVPVFDAQLGLVGIGRAVAWDSFENLVIPCAQLTASVEAVTSQRPRAAEPAEPERAKEAQPARPWWAKPVPRGTSSAQDDESEPHP